MILPSEGDPLKIVDLDGTESMYIITNVDLHLDGSTTYDLLADPDNGKPLETGPA